MGIFSQRAPSQASVSLHAVWRRPRATVKSRGIGVEVWVTASWALRVLPIPQPQTAAYRSRSHRELSDRAEAVRQGPTGDQGGSVLFSRMTVVV